MPLQITAQSASAALDRANARGLLPLDLSSAEIRAQMAEMIRQNSVFSAKTTNAIYLQAIKDRIARGLQGGWLNDFAQLRLELKRELARLGYTPETGFPGDEALGIEPVEAGSLKDLSSDMRLNLILHTQEELMRGAAQKARGEDGSRLVQFPAWELVRVSRRIVPRGSPDSGTQGWPSRFVESGGTLTYDAQGKERMIALKGDPVWDALGSSEIFSDALDVTHPPFAFNSGMGWLEVHHSEVAQLGIHSTSAASQPAKRLTPSTSVPPPKASAHGLDDQTIASLKKSVAGLEAKDGSLLLKNRSASQDVLLRRMERIAKTGKAYKQEGAP